VSASSEQSRARSNVHEILLSRLATGTSSLMRRIHDARSVVQGHTSNQRGRERAHSRRPGREPGQGVNTTASHERLPIAMQSHVPPRPAKSRRKVGTRRAQPREACLGKRSRTELPTDYSLVSAVIALTLERDEAGLCE
jgi:hypothetical protein